MNFNPEFHWQKESKQHLKKRVTRILAIVFVTLFVCVFVITKCHFISYMNMSYDSSIPVDTKAITHIIDADKLLYKNSYDIKYVDDFKNSFANTFNIEKSKVDLLLGYFGKNIYILESGDSQSIIANISNFYIFKNAISSFAKQDLEENINKYKVYTYSLDIKQNNIFNTKESRIYITNLNDYSVVISNDLNELRKILEKNQKDGKENYIKNIKSNVSGLSNKSGIKIKIIDYNNIDNSKSFIKNLSSIYKNTKNNKLFLSADIVSSEINVNLNNNDFINKNFDNFVVDTSKFVVSYINQNKKLETSVDLGANIEKYLDSIIQAPYGLDIKSELLKLNPPFSFFVYKNNNFIFYGKDKQELEYIYKTIVGHFEPSKRLIKQPDGSYASELYINQKSIDLIDREEGDIRYKSLKNKENSSPFLAECGDNSIISNNKDIIGLFCANQLDLNIVKNNDIKEFLDINPELGKSNTGYISGFKDKYSKFRAINMSDNDNISIFLNISE